ncbi:hypothetical protein Hsar01_01185 [Haloferula sargassicola]|uniref:EamA domain-containing protein n=2 Tax=Haloferula sargassicola TaxID=490096 RepID=A0ABP9UKC0_9BACT
MQRVDASHGGVVLGILPLATACAAFFRAAESPSPRFWIWSGAGSATVLAFALSEAGGKATPADAALLAAVACAAIAYAEGGRLSRELGGWQVMCWTLVLGFPLLIGPTAFLAFRHGLHATPAAWAGFAWLALGSSFLGMFAWYHGLALGGVAKVGQLQLLQPFFTFLFAMVFLGERFGWQPIACAALVAAFIALGRSETHGVTPKRPSQSPDSEPVSRSKQSSQASSPSRPSG